MLDFRGTSSSNTLLLSEELGDIKMNDGVFSELYIGRVRWTLGSFVVDHFAKIVFIAIYFLESRVSDSLAIIDSRCINIEHNNYKL